jgi:gluconokinase
VGCHRPVIVVVAGVSGSGKSTVGALLAGRMRSAYCEGRARQIYLPGCCAADQVRSLAQTLRACTRDAVLHIAPWEFIDGDTLHPAANVAKMRAGIPLTDADRAPWLAAIGAWMDQWIAAGTSGVVACSALRRAYRAALLGGRPGTRLVFLRIDRVTAAARLATRHGHFFPASLLDSQFRDLEPPGDGEDALIVEASRPAGELASDIAASLRPSQRP